MSYENVYGRLTPEEADHVYMRFSDLGTSLNLQKWPSTRAEFETYWNKRISMFDKTVISQDTEVLVKFIMFPDGLFFKAFPMWLFLLIFGHPVKIITIEMLPKEAQNFLNMPSTKYTKTLYRVVMCFIRHVYPILPEFIRQSVKNYFLYDMRRRMRRGSKW